MIFNLKKYFSSRTGDSFPTSSLVRLVGRRKLTALHAQHHLNLSPLEVAILLDKEPEEFLSQVAWESSLRSAYDINPPTAQAILNSGFTEQELRDHSIVPQLSEVAPAGVALIVADPSVLSVSDFQDAGIQVLLGYHEKIALAWQNYDKRSQLSSEKSERISAEALDIRALRVLQELIVDCHSLGASEVYIGQPSASRYELLVRDQLYSGSLHAGIYHNLLEVLSRANVLQFTFKLESLKSATATMSKTFQNTVICISWEKPTSRGEQTFEARHNPYLLSRDRESSPLVVLLDDDERFSFLLAKILEQKGFCVERRANGTQLLEDIRNEVISPALIICDVHMPVLSGSDFLKALRKQGNQTRILMLTSDDDFSVEAAVALQGANAFVRKDQDPSILLAWTHNLLTCQTFTAQGIAPHDS